MKHEGLIFKFFEKIKAGVYNFVSKHEELVCAVLAILWLGIILSVSAISLRNNPVSGLVGSFLSGLSIMGSVAFAVWTMILLVGCFKYVVSRYILKWRQEPFAWKNINSYLWEGEEAYSVKKEIKKIVSERLSKK